MNVNECNYETCKHINLVREFINIIVRELLTRGEEHDKSKLESPEAEIFAEVTQLLSGLTYGSTEYNENKKKLGLALSHHYANNRHHPEHFKNGMSDMNLIDLIEMFCDWKAASMRHNDGNLRKSIEINGERFNMSSQLIKIFENTVELIE